MSLTRSLSILSERWQDARQPCIPRLIEGSGKFLAFRCWSDSDGGMIRGGFLGEEDRNKLIALARDGAAASRMTRRANALVLLDDGWSCREVAKALLLDDDTIRGWRKLFEQGGIEGLTSFDMGGSARSRRARSCRSGRF